MAAIESVHHDLEVIDNHYTDFKFALPNVVADKASASCFVISGMHANPRHLDLALDGHLLQMRWHSPPMIL